MAEQVEQMQAFMQGLALQQQQAMLQLQQQSQSFMQTMMSELRQDRSHGSSLDERKFRECGKFDGTEENIVA